MILVEDVHRINIRLVDVNENALTPVSACSSTWLEGTNVILHYSTKRWKSGRRSEIAASWNPVGGLAGDAVFYSLSVQGEWGAPKKHSPLGFVLFCEKSHRSSPPLCPSHGAVLRLQWKKIKVPPLRYAFIPLDRNSPLYDSLFTGGGMGIVYSIGNCSQRKLSTYAK